MKNTTFLFFFFLISFQSFSQAIQTKIEYFKKIKWDTEEKCYYKTVEDTLSESSSSIVTLSYDKFSILLQDTMNLYLNEVPSVEENTYVIQQTWNDVVNDAGKNMFVQLFYFKNDNTYMLRILNRLTSKGFEYFVSPVNQIKPVSKKKKR